MKNYVKRLKNDIRRPLNSMYWAFNSNQYPLIQSSDYLTIKNVIKKSSIEKVHFAEIYGLSKEYEIEAVSPALNIYEFNNASIFQKSDVVLLKDAVYWDKRFNPLFCKTIPLDKNLVKYDQKSITIKSYKKKIRINGKCASLLGVFCDVWSHFLLQYLAKLYFYDKLGILDDEITVIIPKYNDYQLKCVVRDFLKEKNIKIIEAEENAQYLCEKLYYIPSAICFPNHLNYFLPQDCVYSNEVRCAIKNILIDGYSNVNNSDNKFKKIYLARRGTYRCLENWNEVEQYFKTQGFEIVEPHLLTLEEKISIFKSAEVIVGPYSSAFTNILWCSPKTKVLMLSNFPRTLEATFCELGAIAKVCILYVTGVDKENNNPHTSYYIDLEKVKEAYKYLCEK